ncbi:MAG: hypothetical protein M3256_12690 [Actinomycetota bacterium]|nr:hypothetical protein [Actinomycetota bacterium]
MQRWLESLDAGPVLFVLDDLHWADPDSLALLSFLCRRIAPLAVGVMAALRPWPAEAHRLATELTTDDLAALEVLSPLSEGASAAVLAAA